MKIEPGRYYKSRGGEVFGPMAWDGRVWRTGESIINLAYYWNEDGMRFGHQNDRHDLVESAKRVRE
jgi:hypothetical protein